MKVNLFLFLSLFISAVVAIPFYPETSATSFQTNMTQPIRINDDALVRNTAVSSRQQIRSFIYGLMIIQYFKWAILLLGCQVIPIANPACIQVFRNGQQAIFVIITCVVSPTNCPCSNFPTSCSISSNSDDTLTNFHMTETHVQNIRSAIEMVMSNPSARNVDELFNLIIDSAAITNTSSIQDGQDVRQKHLTLPVIPKVASPFVPAAKSQMTTTTQDNIEFKANADGPQILYPLLFPVIHPIVPYSHFQWSMYPRMHPELLRRHPDLV